MGEREEGGVMLETDMREWLVEVIREPVKMFPDMMGSPEVTLALCHAVELADRILARWSYRVDAAEVVRCKDCKRPEKAPACQLTRNYRGWLSTFADQLW